MAKRQSQIALPVSSNDAPQILWDYHFTVAIFGRKLKDSEAFSFRRTGGQDRGGPESEEVTKVDTFKVLLVDDEEEFL